MEGTDKLLVKCGEHVGQTRSRASQDFDTQERETPERELHEAFLRALGAGTAPNLFRVLVGTKHKLKRYLPWQSRKSRQNCELELHSSYEYSMTAMPMKYKRHSHFFPFWFWENGPS